MLLVRTSLVALALLGCGAGGKSHDASPPSANQSIRARERDLLGKDKASVEKLLGAPLKKSYWTNVAIPPDWTPEQRTAFEAGQLDEIWIYATGRVHFSLAGKVLQVDDDTKEVPPA
ncbi:MAG TPA: hypothetical protein VM513_29050 [Kofleriaceae bacterium]|jgi:hypothetical protein|nr:hypothetical protein [Kofleriaceae bacterium]